jgi:hypothetical protein
MTGVAARVAWVVGGLPKPLAIPLGSPPTCKTGLNETSGDGGFGGFGGWPDFGFGGKPDLSLGINSVWGLSEVMIFHIQLTKKIEC